MKSIECPSCKRTVLIEPEINTRDHKNPGHGTVLNDFKTPNTIQCVCGKYI